MNYQPLPNGYKICDECGIGTHETIYDRCYVCQNKIDPVRYPLRNFRASTNDELSLRGASLSKGGGGGDRQDMNPDSDKQVPAPTDPGFNEELINDHE